MPTLPIGFRLRDIRKKKGLKQKELAEKAGISVSYLNLIEHDRRSPGPALLHRLAGGLEIELKDLSTDHEASLIHNLVEMASDPLFRDSNLEPNAPHEIVTRHKNWGQGIFRLYKSYRAASDASDILSARLQSDPFVTDAKHRILSLSTSIRSLSEILQEFSDISADQRQHFVSVVAEESNKLGKTARSLFNFISKTEAKTAPLTPATEVNDFLIDRENYFVELEDAADQLRAHVDLPLEPTTTQLEVALESKHNVCVKHSPMDKNSHAPHAQRAYFDEGRKILFLSDRLSKASARFCTAQYLFYLEFGLLLEQLCEHPILVSEEGKSRARQALARYGAAAILLPYDYFFQSVEELQYDIERLALKFDASYEQICHRLVTLRKPNSSGIPLAFVRVDAGGNVSKRFNLPNLRMPATIGACPLWSVYRAFQTPGRIIADHVHFPNTDDSFIFVARTVKKTGYTYTTIPPLYSVMIAFSTIYAERTVYGQTFAPIKQHTPLLVGSTCRLCPIQNCEHRAFSSRFTDPAYDLE